MQPPVILVIPAWDEAESIGAVLSEVPARVLPLHARLGNSLVLTLLRASLAILRTDLRRLPASTAPHTRAALEALDDVTMRPGRAA